MTDDDQRIAYLAGDAGGSLDPSERAELDDLRGLLADPALWVEPDPALQERIVAAITASAPPAVADLTSYRRSRRRIIYAVAGVAAVALLVVGIAIGTSSHGPRPTEFAASLSGTQLLPQASGQVTLTQTPSGWQIRLHAKGLPRRADGTYYEAWLKNATGQLVPIGTFNQGDNVTLWAGVAPSSYPTLTITRQEANGNPASSGQVVLVGPTHQIH
jgi:hypothetical protein